MQTKYATENYERSWTITTPPLNWFPSKVKEVFGLNARCDLPDGRADFQQVGYTTDRKIAQAWLKKGELPLGNFQEIFRPALPTETIFDLSRTFRSCHVPVSRGCNESGTVLTQHDLEGRLVAYGDFIKDSDRHAQDKIRNWHNFGSTDGAPGLGQA
jgi:hypothetical protein